MHCNCETSLFKFLILLLARRDDSAYTTRVQFYLTFFGRLWNHRVQNNIYHFSVSRHFWRTTPLPLLLASAGSHWWGWGGEPMSRPCWGPCCLSAASPPAGGGRGKGHRGSLSVLRSCLRVRWTTQRRSYSRWVPGPAVISALTLSLLLLIVNAELGDYKINFRNALTDQSYR